MTLALVSNWRDEFVLARDARNIHSPRDLARMVRSGDLVRIARGVYRRRAAMPDVIDDDDRYLALLRATQLVADGPLVLSHLSAARLWGLPVPSRWPESVHAIQPPEAGGRFGSLVVRHGVPLPTPPVHRDGLWCTDLARTVVDVLRVSPPHVGIVVADAAMRGDADIGRDPLDRDEAERILRAVTGGRGTRRAANVLAAADGRAESPGESLSRWAIKAAGLPTPELQKVFSDSRGQMIVDFWWPQFNLIGEFDGAIKYQKDDLLKGRTASEAVIAEKNREDRLRALGPRVARWDWSTTNTPGALVALLRSFGVH
ncbi:type IV toxin-antitoxin system AbiEi family antitoxin domain-containing protein [Herbiconiux sp. L3-i23]|uniref:type IV toxin-antitoxin system AbiEi family antitoxin domain-containing protein n=1 Tax=Herbiconiux sp. L3-i23 TaxID=2905871 RepID=UPI00204706DA|nr:type IV toxin-antitoxin system AbiEi family antitoxin domain-containing protein [Herbiconiux sp. L3-i23]BDI21588.1 hypothetical protein L3i23_03640 [Herbiconiux sp. L3-i23]